MRLDYRGSLPRIQIKTRRTLKVSIGEKKKNVLIRTKMYWVLPRPVHHPSTEFHENRASINSVILETKWKTNRTKDMTSIAEITTIGTSSYK